MKYHDYKDGERVHNPIGFLYSSSTALNQSKSLLLYWLNQSNIKLFISKVICVHILNWALPITNILGVAV